MEKYKNCIGEVFGKLVIEEKIERPLGLNYGGEEWVKCKCACGNTISVAYRALVYKKTKSCGCVNRRRGPEHKDWRGCGEISMDHFSTYKRNAKAKNREFSITLEYAWELFLKQNRKCAITGEELTFDLYGGLNKKRKDTCKITASLDRIDSSLGYVVGNVQWIHKKINIMKNDSPQEEFIEWCKKVANRS